MYSNNSFQTIEFPAVTSSGELMPGYATDNAPFSDIYALLNVDTQSTDSLSPRSYGSLSGDEEAPNSGKRHRSYSSLPQSPKRFRGGAYSTMDEVLLPHSPESGIALSPAAMPVYPQSPSCGKVWIKVLEQPEEYYRARYASEGSRGPLKGRSQNSCPKVKLMIEDSNEHVSATITVSLVHEDNSVHTVCSLATAEEDGPSNVSKRVSGPDFTVEFDQLRVKRERHTGGGKAKHKPKPQKQNEAVGYLMFHADITTISGQLMCETRSEEIKLTSKPESAELHAIKNNYASVEGNEEVWIRGSKMIGNPSVYFEICGRSGKVERYIGTVVREECHQNLLVVKTPRVPYTERVMSQVIVVTGKDKMKSNSLPFMFIPTGTMYHKPSRSPKECVPPPHSRLSPCYSPQPPTPSSAVWGDDLPFFPSTPPANALEGILDMCAQQLDKQVEEEILPTAVLPADTSSLTVDEKELPTGLVPPPCNVAISQQSDDSSMLPPTIFLDATFHQPVIHLDMNTN